MGKSEDEIREYVDSELDSKDESLKKQTYMEERVFKEEVQALDMQWKRCMKIRWRTW